MKTGDKVTWTHITYNGRNVTLRSWEGHLLEDITPGIRAARVERQGKVHRVSVSTIRPVNVKNHLTEMVLDARYCST